jgi:hypothetical protein
MPRHVASSAGTRLRSGNGAVPHPRCNERVRPANMLLRPLLREVVRTPSRLRPHRSPPRGLRVVNLVVLARGHLAAPLLSDCQTRLSCATTPDDRAGTRQVRRRLPARGAATRTRGKAPAAKTPPPSAAHGGNRTRERFLPASAALSWRIVERRQPASFRERGETTAAGSARYPLVNRTLEH